MQKTEKHCKNQCFCYHKTTKISPKTGPKTQKSASGPGHLRNRKKRCCKPKNWGQKVEKHGFFSLFACRFWTGAFTNRCLPYCFLQCFLKASVTTYQKQEVLAEKCPPPGKPVTFYECHPEDHAPAPSVRADFDIYRVRRGVLFRQIPESLRAGDRRRTRRFRDPHLAAGEKHLEKDRIIRWKEHLRENEPMLSNVISIYSMLCLCKTMVNHGFQWDISSPETVRKAMVLAPGIYLGFCVVSASLLWLSKPCGPGRLVVKSPKCAAVLQLPWPNRQEFARCPCECCRSDARFGSRADFSTSNDAAGGTGHFWNT